MSNESGEDGLPLLSFEEQAMLTRTDVMNQSTFYHVTLRNADGTAVRCRANGQLKTWKTRPSEWRLPVKHGLRDCFYLGPSNAHEWLTSDPTEEGSK